MRGLEGEGGGIAENPGPVRDLGESGDAVADNTHFDASQYTFFGKGIVEEVELGGLEDEIDNDIGSGGLADEEYHFSSFGNREEADGTLMCLCLYEGNNLLFLHVFFLLSCFGWGYLHFRIELRRQETTRSSSWAASYMTFD